MADAEKSGPDLVQRLAALTDGVLAITITLLVLDIRLPEPAEGLSDAALWQAVAAVSPRIFSYVLSFVVIANFWTGHVRRFRTVTAVTPALLWLNIGFLITTGLVPFTTSILADNGNATGTGLYAGLIVLSALFLGLMSAHVRSAGLAPADRTSMRMGLVPSLATILVFGLSIPIAFFYDASWAKWFWVLLAPIMLASSRLAHRGKRQDALRPPSS